MTATPIIRPLQLVWQSYVVTFRGLDTILRLSWFAALLLAIVGRIVSGELPESVAGTETETLPASYMLVFSILAIVTAMVHAMVAVGWHRAILRDEYQENRRIYFRLGRNELLYTVAAVFLMVFVMMAVSIVPMVWTSSGADPVSMTVAMVMGPGLVLMLVGRSLLVLPAIAIGRGADLALSWRATSGQVFRVAAVLALMVVPLGLIDLAIIEIVTSVAERDLGVVLNMLASFVVTTVLIVMVSTIVSAASLLYRELVDPLTDPRVFD